MVLVDRYFYYLQFTNEETKAERDCYLSKFNREKISREADSNSVWFFSKF